MTVQFVPEIGVQFVPELAVQFSPEYPDNLESKLLECELELEKNEFDTTLIHVSFRFAHNVKSLLAMAEKVECAALIHTIENQFDLIRKDKAVVKPLFIEKCLSALDLIMQNLDLVVEDKLSLSALSNEIRDLYAINENYEDKQPNNNLDFRGLKLSDEQLSNIEQLDSQGKFIYLIEKLIKVNVDLEFYKNLPVFEDVNRIGNLITFFPTPEQIPTKGEEFIIKILFSTELNEEDIEYEIFDPIILINKKSNKSDYKVAECATPHITNELNSKPSALLLIDDYTLRRKFLHTLDRICSCDIAFDYEESKLAFLNLFEEGKSYEFIFVCASFLVKNKNIVHTYRLLKNEKSMNEFHRIKIIVVLDNKHDDDLTILNQRCDYYLKQPYTTENIQHAVYKYIE